MSKSENETRVRRFYEEVWNSGNFNVADEVFAEEYLRHDPRPMSPTAGPGWQKEGAKRFRDAFPDNRLELSFIISDEEMVAARWVITGTHEGKWAGVEPTRKKVKFSGINIFRFEKGKVVEVWNHRDDLSLMEQIGALGLRRL